MKNRRGRESLICAGEAILSYPVMTTLIEAGLGDALRTARMCGGPRNPHFAGAELADLESAEPTGRGAEVPGPTHSVAVAVLSLET